MYCLVIVRSNFHQFKYFKKQLKAKKPLKSFLLILSINLFNFILSENSSLSEKLNDFFDYPE